MADIVFVGQFVASKTGKTGLTVTVDVDRYTISDGSRIASVTAGSATEGRRGLYHYRLASADLALYQYVATFITADATVDQQEIAAIGLVVPDALVSSRAAVGEAPTEAEIIAAMDADPPAVNVTMLKGVAAPDAWPTAVEIRQEIDANSTLLTALAAIFSGITSLPKWLRGMYRKDAMDATAKAEVNASGGAFDEAMDSLEAIRDRGDAAWSQSGSGLYSETITVDDGTNFLDGVLVQVATDAAYSNVIRSGYTNDLGQWTFRCDTPGTYYGRAELAGKNVREFTITVSA